MDHIRILRRAFEITRSYRALWVFGILLALTTSNGGSGSGGGGGGSNMGTSNQTPFNPVPGFHMPDFSTVLAYIIPAAIALVCLGLVMIVVATIIHYVSNTALIDMVNRHEDTGEKVSIGTGFQWGWSRSAFRTWLLDFGIGIVGFVVFGLLFLIAAAPLLLWATRNNTAGVIGTVMSIGLIFLVIMLVLLVAAVVSILVELAQRIIIVEKTGVIEGLTRAWTMAMRRPGDIIVMGLILFGLQLAWSMLMIPVVLILLVAGGLLGGIPGLLVGGLTALLTHGSIAWVIGLIIGLPILFLVLFLPLLFLGGIFKVFTSSTWTLTYRELIALNLVQPPVPPEIGPEPTPTLTPLE